MKHLPQRLTALLLAAAMSLTLTGCMFRSSVEDLFTLPRVAAACIRKDLCGRGGHGADAGI